MAFLIATTGACACTLEIGNDVKSQLKQLLQDFTHWPIAVDETKGITSQTQMAIFVRGVTQEFEVREELLALKCVKDKRGE